MKLFKSFLFWGTLVVILAAAGLYMLLPFMTVKDALLRILISLLFLVTALAAVIILNYRHLFSTLKKSKESQQDGFSGAEALDRTWLQPLQNETAEALELLKKAGNMGRSRGTMEKGGFYLVMGNTGSGKTYLLENSGLHFSCTHPSDEQVSSRMMSFFRWRIVKKNAYIEVPSHMLTGNEKNIKEEYAAFLSYLNNEGKEKAIDGIVLTVNLEELLGTIQDVEIIATQLRENINTTMHLLELEIPVYLVFTHSDIFPGFSDYFSSLKGIEQNQVLGATMSLSGQTVSVRQRFETEFDKLHHNISEKLLPLLHAAGSGEEREHIFLFPNEFLAAREKLSRFVELLFKKSVHNEGALFRGFFFTSVTPVSEDISGSAGFTEKASAGFTDTIVSHPLNPRAGKEIPVFKRDSSQAKNRVLFTGLLFNGILNQEQGLSRFPRYRRSRLSRNTFLASLLFFLMALCLFIYGIVGYINSTRLSGEIAAGIKKAEALNWKSAEKFSVEYSVLEELGRGIDKLDVWNREGSPWSIAPGFYKGREAVNLARKVYYYQLYRLVLESTLQELQGDLHYSSYYVEDEKDRLYADLKLYLALTDLGIPYRETLDVYDLRQGLVSRWMKLLNEQYGLVYLPANFERSLEAHANRYAADAVEGRLPTDGLQRFRTDKKAVAEARNILQGKPSIDALYNSIVQSATEFKDISLTDMGISKEGLLSSDSKVRGFYTKEAFQKGALDYIEKGAEKPHQKDWVLGEKGIQLPPDMKDKRQLVRALKARYFSEYADEWSRFLGSMRVDVPADLKSLSGRLLGFSSETQGLNAVFVRLLKEVDLIPPKNVHVDNKVKKRMKKSLLGKVARDKLENRADPRKDLKAGFASVDRLAGMDGGLLKHYYDGIKRLGDAMSRISFDEDKGPATLAFIQEVFSSKSTNPLVYCWNQSVGIKEQVPDQVKEWLGPLLQDPLLTITANLTLIAEEKLEEQYKTNIYTNYVQRLKGRYPFERKGLQEVNLEDINYFFNKGDGVFLTFLKSQLSPYLSSSAGVYSVKQWNGIKVRISGSALKTINQGSAFSDRIFLALAKKMREFPVNVTLFQSPNVASVMMRIGDSKITVKQGTAKLSQRVTWPGDNAHKGAAIQVQLPNGKTRSIEAAGPWGFLRLLEKTRSFDPYSNGFTAVWRLRVEGKYDIDVKVEGEIRETSNPFTSEGFYRFECAPELIEKKKPSS
jgi:type VI secretion system protein ImpL